MPEFKTHIYCKPDVDLLIHYCLLPKSTLPCPFINQLVEGRYLFPKM